MLLLQCFCNGLYLLLYLTDNIPFKYRFLPSGISVSFNIYTYFEASGLTRTGKNKVLWMDEQ